MCIVFENLRLKSEKMWFHSSQIFLAEKYDFVVAKNREKMTELVQQKQIVFLKQTKETENKIAEIIPVQQIIKRIANQRT